MATQRITTDQNVQYDISASDTTYILGKGVTISSPEYGIYSASMYDNIVINVEGRIEATSTNGAGIYANGNGLDVDISESGKILGTYGILAGPDTTVVNRGEITTTKSSIWGQDGMRLVNLGTIESSTGSSYFSGYVTEAEIVNKGTMKSAVGIYVNADHLDFRFGKGSLVEAENNVLTLVSEDGDTSHVVNKGDIRATITNTFLEAIKFGDGSDTLRNSGDIWGSVYLGDGADHFDGRGGHLHKGNVLGEGGDDTYKIGNAKTHVFEAIGEGYDVLSVGSTYTLEASCEIEEIHLSGKGDFNLTGNLMSNQLFGNAGSNRIEPSRLCRRPQLVRSRVYDKQNDEQIFS